MFLGCFRTLLLPRGDAGVVRHLEATPVRVGHGGMINASQHFCKRESMVHTVAYIILIVSSLAHKTFSLPLIHDTVLTNTCEIRHAIEGTSICVSMQRARALDCGVNV